MHVDDLLDQLTVEEFEERFCEWVISGAGDARYLASVLAVTGINQTTRYMCFKNGDTNLESRWLSEDAFLPRFMRGRKKSKGVVKSNDPRAFDKLSKRFTDG